MSTYTQILYQIVFGSKDYTSFLTKVNQDILYNYIAGILWNKKYKPHIVGGYCNHIHIVCDLHPAIEFNTLRGLFYLLQSRTWYPAPSTQHLLTN